MKNIGSLFNKNMFKGYQVNTKSTRATVAVPLQWYTSKELLYPNEQLPGASDLAWDLSLKNQSVWDDSEGVCIM